VLLASLYFNPALSSFKPQAATFTFITMYLAYKYIKRKKAESQAKRELEAQETVTAKVKSAESGPTDVVSQPPVSRASQLDTPNAKKSKSKARPCEHQRLAASQAASSNIASTEGAQEKSTASPERVDNLLQMSNASAQDGQYIGSSNLETVELGEKYCPICKEQKKAARKYRWKLMAGLFFPFALQALDATVIASALPFIASDFRECLMITSMQVSD
jgi:hypothetical protein